MLLAMKQLYGGQDLEAARDKDFSSKHVRAAWASIGTIVNFTMPPKLQGVMYVPKK